MKRHFNILLSLSVNFLLLFFSKVYTQFNFLFIDIELKLN